MSLRALLFAAAVLAAPAAAQVTPAPVPTPTIPADASAVPPPVSVTLPTPVPVVRPTPVPAPTATPVVRPTPVPTATATPRPAATSASIPTPRAEQPAAAATPSPVATTPASPAPDLPPPVPPARVAAQPAPALPVAPERGSPWALWTVGGLLIAVALVAFVARRRRHLPGPEQVPNEVPVAPEPAAPVPARAAQDRAWIDVALRPRRAGVNLLTATLDAEVVVRNDGDRPAEDVCVVLHLLSAGAGQDEAIARLLDAPGGRPVAAPFALAPAEERVLGAMATMPRGDIAVLTAGDRPMFVPVAAVDVRYRSGEAEGRTSGAFAIGIERAGAAKLAPFRLDAPAQMHDQLGVRPHGAPVRR